jgi:hypothetical protein
MKRRACFLLLTSLLPSSAQAPQKGSAPASPRPELIAAQMVSSLPCLVPRTPSFQGFVPCFEAYSKGVASNYNKGLIALDDFGYHFNSPSRTPTEGLEAWLSEWFAGAGRLGVDMGNWPFNKYIAAKALPKLYDRSGKANPAVAQMYLARLKAMSPQLVDDWFNATSGLSPDRGILVHLLVQYDPVFNGSTLRDARIQPELQKLKSMPSEAVYAWSSATLYCIHWLKLLCV